MLKLEIESEFMCQSAFAAVDTLIVLSCFDAQLSFIIQILSCFNTSVHIWGSTKDLLTKSIMPFVSLLNLTAC